MTIVRLYAMAATLIEEIGNGENIASDLRMIKATSKEEASLIYTNILKGEFPNHKVWIRVLVMDVSEIIKTGIC